MPGNHTYMLHGKSPRRRHGLSKAAEFELNGYFARRRFSSAMPARPSSETLAGSGTDAGVPVMLMLSKCQLPELLL